MDNTSYITFLVRQEYDSLGILCYQKVVDWKISDSILSVGDFKAQRLSPYYSYRAIGTFTINLNEILNYISNKGMLWKVNPPSGVQA